MPVKTNRKRAKEPDPRQGHFFHLLTTTLDLPQPMTPPPDPEPDPLPGRYDDDQAVRRLVNELIRASGLDRETLAERMTRLSGHKVTKSMVDSWTGAGRPNMFPLHYLRALIRGCDAGPEAELALLTALLAGTGWCPMDASRAQLAVIGQYAGAALMAFSHAQTLVGNGGRR